MSRRSPGAPEQREEEALHPVPASLGGSTYIARTLAREDTQFRSGIRAALKRDMLTRIAPKLTVVALLGAIISLFLSGRPIKHPPGMLVPNAPDQRDIPPKTLPSVRGWSLTALAEYHLRGRVLGTKRYRSGVNAELAPTDVAVGWGKMSDQAVLDQFSLSMTNRFFFYEWSAAPAIPVSEIETSAANNHVIPANDDVRRVIRSLRSGHIVTMNGYLVNAIGPDGATWNSSLRRDDTGNGACELFYVESAGASESLADEP